jgi:hypothetical protein
LNQPDVVEGVLFSRSFNEDAVFCARLDSYNSSCGTNPFRSYRAVESNVRADIQNAHTGFKQRLKDVEIRSFIAAEHQIARDDGIFLIQHNLHATEIYFGGDHAADYAMSQQAEGTWLKKYRVNVRGNRRRHPTKHSSAASRRHGRHSEILRTINLQRKRAQNSVCSSKFFASPSSPIKIRDAATRQSC